MRGYESEKNQPPLLMLNKPTIPHRRSNPGNNLPVPDWWEVTHPLSGGQLNSSPGHDSIYCRRWVCGVMDYVVNYVGGYSAFWRKFKFYFGWEGLLLDFWGAFWILYY
ncbi:uncharacterized protein BDW43DRAFT_292979 [Aspergillus alliaceus]|uniref:uncharacterized protein n=1 Tax=Petromyces alliaceus TaxID=209559 RepID=UPI0012A51388|nr:uncharacterized protein BDW43DRAFT_292979 [Aspergillus alliaceus]KAB8227859.1 hypothetical protein BDW43DRAFT_292979 [Aspergillus alliaceus]